MKASKKYELGQVDWGKVENDVADAVLQQYRNRLDTSIENFNALESKARYGLTGMIGLTTAVLAYTNGKEVGLSLQIMLVGLVISAFGFVLSLWTRKTSGTGVTPAQMKLGYWANGMTNKHARNEMIGVVICQYAENISLNEGSCGKKSYWIRAGMLGVMTTMFDFFAKVFVRDPVSER